MMMIISPKSISLALWATISIFIILSLSTPTHQLYNHTQTTIGDNPRLENAYKALQAWKKTFTSDPNNFTSNWEGYDVCEYKGVYCAPAPDNPSVTTVAGIDLNHANIEGKIPKQVGSLLTDLALLHLNSNRFFGPIPSTFSQLKLLFELDISNNNFCGEIPSVLFTLKSLKFLDIRYNQFYGSIPPFVFKLKLDALFLNHNNFSSYSPGSVGQSPVSVLVMGNNNLNRCFPPKISKMRKTLDEIILSDSGLTGCLPADIGKLTKTRVLDISFNDLTGKLPKSIGDMKALEQLDVSYNKFYGEIPSSFCNLPRLENFTYTHNYFSKDSPRCLKLQTKDDKFNCIPHRPLQRSNMECKSFLKHPPKCTEFTCQARLSSPPTPTPSPPHY